MAALVTVSPFIHAQSADTSISLQETKNILSYLASDELKGRGNGRPELLTAANYIGNYFKEIGLSAYGNESSVYIPFQPFGGSNLALRDIFMYNGRVVPASEYAFFNVIPGWYPVKELTDFTVIQHEGAFTSDILEQYKNTEKPLLIWTDQSTPDKKKLPKQFNIPKEGLHNNIILVYAATAPTSIKLTANAKVYSMLQYNVVGMLKGSTKPDEFIILSAHYDHEGVYKTKKKKDSIMNGANDNASGTTALLQLAKHFAQQQNNERSILFCAFSGEELGLLGSETFSREVDHNKVIALINLEMLGVNQFGRNKVFITGAGYSALPRLLSEELTKNGLEVIDDPDVDKLLFQRSDNFPFAQKGIPAHTIMASNDEDKCYHEPCDDIKRIDFVNLNNIIKALSTAIQPFTSINADPGRITRPVE